MQCSGTIFILLFLFIPLIQPISITFRNESRIINRADLQQQKKKFQDYRLLQGIFEGRYRKIRMNET